VDTDKRCPSLNGFSIVRAAMLILIATSMRVSTFVAWDYRPSACP